MGKSEQEANTEPGLSESLPEHGLIMLHGIEMLYRDLGMVTQDSCARADSYAKPACDGV